MVDERADNGLVETVTDVVEAVEPVDVAETPVDSSVALVQSPTGLGVTSVVLRDTEGHEAKTERKADKTGLAIRREQNLALVGDNKAIAFGVISEIATITYAILVVVAIVGWGLNVAGLGWPVWAAVMVTAQVVFVGAVLSTNKYNRSVARNKKELKKGQISLLAGAEDTVCFTIELAGMILGILGAVAMAILAVLYMVIGATNVDANESEELMKAAWPIVEYLRGAFMRCFCGLLVTLVVGGVAYFVFEHLKKK